MKKTLWVITVATSLLVSAPLLARTWYVDASVSASGDGTSWATAFRKIQEGIDAASDGDTVIVAQGTYLENVEFRGKNIILRSTDPFDPSVVASAIIDGNKAGSVVTFSGTEDESCVLAGFTIRNGEAHAGGGIRGGTYEQHCRATIENNVVTENTATYFGGLCYCDGKISSNTILRNSAEEGGGLCLCDGVIENNIVEANVA